MKEFRTTLIYTHLLCICIYHLYMSSSWQCVYLCELQLARRFFKILPFFNFYRSQFQTEESDRPFGDNFETACIIFSYHTFKNGLVWRIIHILGKCKTCALYEMTRMNVKYCEMCCWQCDAARAPQIAMVKVGLACQDSYCAINPQISRWETWGMQLTCVLVDFNFIFTRIYRNPT